MPVHWQVGLFPIPLVGRALSLVRLEGDGLKAACLLMGGAVIPPGLLFALGRFSADGRGQISPKWPPPEEGRLLNIPQSFASNVLPPKPHSPLFS